MKKKRLFLLIFLILLVTGCSNVSYDLEVNLNSNKEKIYFEYVQIDDLDSILEETLKNNPTMSGENIDYMVTNSSVEIINLFDDIEDITNNSAIFMIYNDSEVKKTNNVTQVKLTHYNPSLFECGEFSEFCDDVIDGLTVNIVSEYKIISSNADVVDEKKNKYTWYFNGTPRETLYFSYNDEIRWDIVIKNFIKNNINTITLISILVGILIVGLIFVGIFFKKMKANND